jgi:hypothetical protein
MALNEINNQVVGNIGLYYVCYRLSRLGWNVMPTARNARRIDFVIYSQDAQRTRTIQVKALLKRSPVPLGNELDRLFDDYFVICQNALFSHLTKFVSWFIVEKKTARPVIGYSPSNMKKKNFVSGGGALELAQRKSVTHE